MQRFHAEFRAEMTGDTLAGYAAVFGPVAKLARSYERLAPTAFDDALAKGADVRALVNHDPSKLLARTSSGTLKLGTDSHGLHFEAQLPNTSYANDLRELVARGDLNSMSFGFVPGKQQMSTAPNGAQLRTHTSLAQLLDVSPVTFPAYEGTEVSLRSDWEWDEETTRSKLVRARARVHINTHKDNK
jgi:HK97 family phage prohead protease